MCLIKNKGFSLLEVVIAAGISTILALGMSPLIIQMANMQNKLEADALLSDLAMSVIVNLKDGGTCAARTTVPGFNLVNAQTNEGTPVQISLASQGNFLISDGVTYNMGPASINVETVRISNATIVGTDANSTILVGDILLGMEARDDAVGLGSGPLVRRKISAGRLSITITNATSAVESCNSQTSYNASTETCTDMGASFEPSCPASTDGCCVWNFNENPGPIDFCQLGEAGYVDPDAGPVCEVANSTCPEAASGISLGSFECAPVVSVADGDVAPLAPALALPPASIGPAAPPAPAGIEPECLPRWQTYSACMASSTWSRGAFTCGAVPPITNCSAMASLAIPSPDPAAVLPPIPATCNCGASTVNDGQYCGFCTLDLDYGFGFIETVYEVRQCNAGALVIVPNAASVVPVSSIQCNGARRFLNNMGGDIYAF